MPGLYGLLLWQDFEKPDFTNFANRRVIQNHNYDIRPRVFCNRPSNKSLEIEISRVLTRGIQLDYTRPGKPTDNCFIESFYGKLKDECLNENWFTTIKEAREIIRTWLTMDKNLWIEQFFCTIQ